jgi:hypothetical protein
MTSSVRHSSLFQNGNAAAPVQGDFSSKQARIDLLEPPTYGSAD